MRKEHIINTYKKKAVKNWDVLYWAVDIHDTCIKANYKANDIPTEFYPGAMEALQRLSKRSDCCLILWTCSYPHEIKQYLKMFKDNGINFKYVNKNPEAKDTAFGYFKDKFYTNFMLDDKADFQPEDWKNVHDALDEIEKTELVQSIVDGKYKKLTYHTYPTGTIDKHHIVTLEENTDLALDLAMHKIFHQIFQDVALETGINPDNKTAVGILVDGRSEPVYLSMYDFKYRIVGKIADNRGGKTINLKQQ